MATTRFAVKGLPELKALFARVSEEVGKRALRRGVSAGAKIVKAAIQSAAPVGNYPTHGRGSKRRPSGTLKRAIITKFAREKSDATQATMLVTVRQGRRGAKKKLAASRDAYYGKYVERGHRIVPRSKRIGTYRGKALYRKTITARRKAATGRVPPHPFMAPAFAASKDRAVAAMVSTMTAELQKVIGSS